MRSRLYNLLYIFLINLIFVGFGILIIELIFGNWISSNNIDKLNIIRSRTISYNIAGLYDYPSNTITYVRDKYGLRGSYDKIADIDILTVGGSTTDQRYINEGQTWQDLLQSYFQNTGVKTVIANAGIDGLSSYGLIKCFDSWLPYIPLLKPRYVIFYLGINDFYTFEGRKYDNLIKTTGKETIRQKIERNSALYNLYNLIKNTYKTMAVLKMGHHRVDFTNMKWTEQGLLATYDDVMETKLSSYRDRLDLLLKKCRDFGSEPIIITTPTRKYKVFDGRIVGTVDREKFKDYVEINGIDFYHMLGKINSATMEICKKNNGICIDLATETEGKWEDQDFYDFYHMTPKGTKKIATYLFDKMKDYKISPE